MSNRIIRTLFILLINMVVMTLFAQEDELIGGVQFDSGTSTDGYILFSPVGLTGTYLINKQGEVINAWDSDYAPASAMYLTDEGHLIRAGRRGQGSRTERVLEEWDWSGNLIWQYVFESPDFTQHHDIEPMPNGNILVLAWEHIPIDEAIELGFATDGLTLPDGDPLEDIRLDSIFEIDPQIDGVVWEWYSRDHLIQDVNPDKPNYGDIADFPRRINLNYHDVVQIDDITHINSIAYHASRDEIIVSVRSFSEIWVIDHSITTDEARGTAGDLLYRWGNPQAYGQDTAYKRTLYFQHDARWLDIDDDNSTLTLFNNGSRDYEVMQSELIQFSLPDQRMADDTTFNSPQIIWQSQGDFFAMNMSGGVRLSNGHAFITLAPDGRFIEITDDGQLIWDYINPVYRETDGTTSNRVFRASFYSADFVGFAGKTLRSQGTLRKGLRE